MLDSIWQGFLMLVFGTSVVITPATIILGPGETFIPSAKPIEPVSETMQVFINLGELTEERKKAIVSGQFGLADSGKVEVQVCGPEQQCHLMNYEGPFFSKDLYGISFSLSDPKIRGKSFTAVKVRSERRLPGVTVRWQNYSK